MGLCHGCGCRFVHCRCPRRHRSNIGPQGPQGPQGPTGIFTGTFPTSNNANFLSREDVEFDQPLVLTTEVQNGNNITLGSTGTSATYIQLAKNATFLINAYVAQSRPATTELLIETHLDGVGLPFNVQGPATSAASISSGSASYVVNTSASTGNNNRLSFINKIGTTASISFGVTIIQLSSQA